MPALSNADLAAVVKELRGWLDDQTHPATQRDALAMHLGLIGLRISEVCNLVTGDWNPGKQLLWIATLKGGPGRALMVPKWMAPHFTRWSQWTEDREAFMLPTQTGQRLDPRNLRRRFRALTLRVCSRPYRFHDLRHTAASIVYRRSGGNLITVSWVLRHASLSNTVLYVQTDDDIRNFMDMLDFDEPPTEKEQGT